MRLPRWPLFIVWVAHLVFTALYFGLAVSDPTLRWLWIPACCFGVKVTAESFLQWRNFGGQNPQA